MNKLIDNIKASLNEFLKNCYQKLPESIKDKLPEDLESKFQGTAPESKSNSAQIIQNKAVISTNDKEAPKGLIGIWKDDEKRRKLIVWGTALTILGFLLFDEKYMEMVKDPKSIKKITNRVKGQKVKKKNKKIVIPDLPPEVKKKIAKKKEPTQEIVIPPAPKVEQSPVITEPQKPKETVRPKAHIGEVESKVETNHLPKENIAPIKKSSLPIFNNKKKSKLGMAVSSITKIKSNIDSIKALEEKVKYTSPPNYLSLGRGLVYNCKELHWACVDRMNYFKCRKNKNWSKMNGKGPECVPDNVYANIRDCQIVQTHNVNIAKKVNPCQN